MTQLLKRFKSDSMDINIDLGLDITGYQIRAEIWDNQTPVNSIKKANNAVTGGDSTQIEVSNAVTGSFIIHILANETLPLEGDIKVEIEVTKPSGFKETVYSNHLQLLEKRITWVNKV